ncbi:gliding motility-associated lipoprotein GldB [Pustulibacterium marinum]|uniref:Gliding motility-associated lipoprotein GldB n=1 Tax=Pustulibacterium marinum TaxID=1224947 RepID=A0A1I7GM62_9FLAO|nr:gliding motility lipoprotein GldB [Pustulibacterium marinum]SFU49592.1 gliding motility-associated lipoprotein GldB [Pustulibacterium marinum]
MKKIAAILCLLLLFSCNKTSKIEKEISTIPVDFSVLRFDLDYKKAKPSDLPVLKEKYPYMFSKQFPDSVWVARMTDTLQQELFTEVENKFPNFDNQKETLKKFFQHVKYYFPEETIPTVVTVTSDVDYRNQVFYTNDFLIIALDTYLGGNHRFYDGIQQYISKTLDPKYMIVDVARAFSERHVSAPNSRTFLASMIYQGKKMFLEDKLLPFKTSAEKMEYSNKEYEFAIENEAMIWQYFVENELLYDTSPKTLERFIYNAPFSKFYLPVDNESPGRLGVFIGAQIVSSYMQNNDVSLQQMLNTSSEEIFKNAQYKPKK